MKPISKNLTRTARGQATIVMTLVLAFFVLLVVGFFGFEMNRLEAARLQLRSATEAAALAGAATLASQDNTDPTAAQTSASNTAMTAFRLNNVIGNSLANAQPTINNPDNPSGLSSTLYIEFLDPHNNNAVVPLGDPRGKIVRATGNFGYLPAFGNLLPFGNAPLHATAEGGVPNLDVVLCFDVSASIDDQTPVTFVKRTWNAAKNKIDYLIPPTNGAAPAGPIAQGRIFDVIGPPAMGSAVDGVYPQQLTDSNTPGKNLYPLNFSEQGGRPGAAIGLRGTTDAGSFPGNRANPALTGDAHTYTDLVVNIDGNTTFKGAQDGSYIYPDVATLVEAARGNLEDPNVFSKSGANLSVPNSVKPLAGYKADYFKLAAANLHPLRDAQDASQAFLTIMNTNTDAHFSLVCFTTNAGTAANTTYNMANVDGSYGPAGNGNFLVPLIAMNSSPNITNYQTCYDTMPKTLPVSGTNLGDAVNTAVNQLRVNARPGSKKAIVLFTDGQPTSAGPLDNDPWLNGRKAAQAAAARGIPVYTVGLAQNPAIIPGETAILNDTNKNAATGGMAAIAGNGGKFFLVTKTSDLRATFENIARQLVQLVN